MTSSSQFEKMLHKPRTIAISSRLDARTLASLDSFWKSQSQIPRSTSELVRVSLEYFSELLQFKQLTTHFATQESALEYLSNTSLTFKTQKDKLTTELLDADISEEVRRRLTEKKDSPPNLSIPSSHPLIKSASEILDAKISNSEK
jgi:hypothetical protein